MRRAAEIGVFLLACVVLAASAPTDRVEESLGKLKELEGKLEKLGNVLKEFGQEIFIDKPLETKSGEQVEEIVGEGPQIGLGPPLYIDPEEEANADPEQWAPSVGEKDEKDISAEANADPEQWIPSIGEEQGEVEEDDDVQVGLGPPIYFNPDEEDNTDVSLEANADPEQQPPEARPDEESANADPEQQPPVAYPDEESENADPEQQPPEARPDEESENADPEQQPPVARPDEESEEEPIIPEIPDVSDQLPEQPNDESDKVQTLPELPKEDVIPEQPKPDTPEEKPKPEEFPLETPDVPEESPEAPKPEQMPEAPKPEKMPEAPKPEQMPEAPKPEQMPEAPKPEQLPEEEKPTIVEVVRHKSGEVAKREQEGGDDLVEKFEETLSEDDKTLLEKYKSKLTLLHHILENQKNKPVVPEEPARRELEEVEDDDEEIKKFEETLDKADQDLIEKFRSKWALLKKILEDQKNKAPVTEEDEGEETHENAPGKRELGLVQELQLDRDLIKHLRVKIQLLEEALKQKGGQSTEEAEEVVPPEVGSPPEPAEATDDHPEDVKEETQSADSTPIQEENLEVRLQARKAALSALLQKRQEENNRLSVIIDKLRPEDIELLEKVQSKLQHLKDALEKQDGPSDEAVEVRCADCAEHCRCEDKRCACDKPPTEEVKERCVDCDKRCECTDKRCNCDTKQVVLEEIEKRFMADIAYAHARGVQIKELVDYIDEHLRARKKG